MLPSVSNSKSVLRPGRFFHLWADSFKTIGHEIQGTVQETEKEFLAIGTGLQEFYKRSETISRMSSQIAHVLSGEEISSAIQRLNSLVTRINDAMIHSKHETEMRTEKLQSLINTIVTITGLLEEMTGNIKSLKVLGMTSRIYSNNSSNYNLLAADVKRLAADMTSKTAHMLDGVQLLRIKIKDTRSTVIDLNEIQKSKTKQILEKTLFSISSLTEKYGFSKTIANDISMLSENTSKSISEVVRSLQFHDIVCQKIAQIKESLYALQDRIELTEYKENIDDSETVKLISETEAFCNSQAEKLGHLSDKMTSAVNSVIENMRAINKNVIDITHETQILAGDIEKEHAFFSEIEEGLSIITSAISLLAENTKASKELSKSISMILLDELSAFLKDIGMIQDEMQLIALNAAVKAGNMEKEGAVLNLIAEYLSKLSSEIRGQTGMILQLFKSMTSVTEELSASIYSERERDAQVYDMVAEFDLLSRSFNQIHTDITSLLASVDSEGKRLSEDMDSTIQGIHINDMFLTVCGRVMSAMKSIVSDIRSLMSMNTSLKETLTIRMVTDQLQEKEQKCDSEKYPEKLLVRQGKSSEPQFDDNVELF